MDQTSLAPVLSAANERDPANPPKRFAHEAARQSALITSHQPAEAVDAGDGVGVLADGEL